VAASRGRRVCLALVLLVAAIGCDQTAKQMARESLSSDLPVSLLNGLVRLEYTENPGAFLSLGAGLPPDVRFLLLVVFTSILLGFVLVFLLRSVRLSTAQTAGLSLLIAGGSGNLLDRMLNDGAVVDFVSVGIGSLRTGVFNLADLAIVFGLLLFWVGEGRTKARKVEPTPS
jgi:signal peptidase II